ncbi:cation diffusion facilitator family transporter [Thermodesulfobacteriota bacterium]
MTIGHDHDHDNQTGSGESRLGFAIFLTAAYMVVEAVGGFVFNSLALLADAGHMLSDVGALVLSWFAIRLGKRSPTDRLTYGFKRSEILAALFNGLALWAIVAVIFYEAVHRFYSPPAVNADGMLIVAGVGLLVNLVMVALLFRSRRENLNIRGAFLHVLSDALGSVGAIAAALIILATGFTIADPLVSILIGVLVLYSSWGLVKESVLVLMEGVPSHLNIREVEDTMLAHEEVCCIHDLHVWSITSNKVSLSAHAVVMDSATDRDGIIRDLQDILRDKFGVEHTTIQIETSHDMAAGENNDHCRGAGYRCNADCFPENRRDGD